MPTNMTRYSRSPTRLLFGFALVAGLARAQWVTTATDTVTHSFVRKWLSMQALAIDSTGSLHGAWTEQVTTTLRRVVYACRPADSSWREPVTVADSTNNHCAIAVEPGTGHAHIAWTVPTGTTADVMYATNRSGQWQSTRLSSDSLAEWLPSIALEPDGAAHVAWIVQDITDAYHIAYATNRSGSWRAQVLQGSQLGGFGSGAAPWLAVAPDGIVHVTYRGGDYPEYHVHHAQNVNPDDTVWTYEILATGNPADYTSAVYAADSGELFAVVSGDEGWGMPCHTYFLHRPPNTNQWDPAELMTASASASMRGFAQDGRLTHCTWERINGNIRTEEIYHCSNIRGFWYNSPIRADGITSNGALALDQEHRGYCLVLAGAAMDSQQVYCVHSAPLTGVEEPSVAAPVRLSAPASVSRVPVRLSGLAGTVRVIASDGRLIRALRRDMTRFGSANRDRVPSDAVLWDGCDRVGCAVPAGVYIATSEGSSTRFVLVR